MSRQALRKFQGETTDYSVHGLSKAETIVMSAQAPSKAASDLARLIQEAQANLKIVLEQVAIATRRGLDDSTGATSGSGEPVGGTRDFTQGMLNKLGGGGSKDLKDQDDNVIDSVPAPIERQDEARRHLGLLVASVAAMHAWSVKARVETFQLTPLSLEKAKLLLGDGPSKCGNPNHERDVWNTPQDRLRAGQCEPCYRYWDKHDRNEYRPRALCHPESVPRGQESAAL